MTSIFDNMPPVMENNRTVGVGTPVSTPIGTPVQAAIPAVKTSGNQTDTVEISAEKPKKQGPIKRLKGFIANIKKFFASAGEYVKGGTKGIVHGAVIGSIVYTGSNVIKHFAKEGSRLSKLHSKPLAILSGIGVLAGNLWTASLNATEKSSEIDHRWTGHKK
ncbi:hypothetical protein IJD44_03105 [bacterium]|nr:hypothetical protein [bacterium]